MPKFKVTVVEHISYQVEVESEDESSAKEDAVAFICESHASEHNPAVNDRFVESVVEVAP